MSYESVDHPNHYTQGRQFEPDDVIEDWGLGYRAGCALKYIARNGRKPGEDPLEGLQKAVWYLNREIDKIKTSRGIEGVSYEDILEDSIASAVNEREELYEYGVDEDIYVPFSDDECWKNVWEDYENTPDSSVRLTEEEIDNLFHGKDLSNVEDNQSIAVIEKNGSLIRLNKDRSYYKVGQLWQDNCYS